MPSVEMRRSTRVFGARVLRSGRRLFTTEEKLKHMRRTHLAVEDADENWIELLDHGNGWHNSHEENKDELMDIDDEEPESEINLGDSKRNSVPLFPDNTGCRRWGLVYTRKRKRISTNTSSLDHDTSDKKFGKKFVRKQPRKTIITEESATATEIQPKIPSKRNKSQIKRHLPLRSKSKRKKLQTGTITNTSNLNLPSRNTITIHRAIQKRRTSFRSRKRKNPSSLIQDGVPFFPIKSTPFLPRSTPKPNFKELKSTITELTQNLDSATCTANILIIHPDRCHREKNAVISISISSSKQYSLIVNQNGSEKFRVETRPAMRPCFINRVTHAIIWAGHDESYKLEFPNRRDWFIFKELYRKCSEKNSKIKPPVLSIIPIPKVNEVEGYADVAYEPFKMPDLYISVRGDEVARVLERCDNCYDMDSEDDEWLEKFNVDRDVKVNEEEFERVIGGFERGVYECPDEFADVATVVEKCHMLGDKKVLEGVCEYWMAKRKKKHSALVRVFQFYKPKRTEQLNIKAVLRKKRSFRKRGNQSGRGKQLTFLKAALYEEEAENAVKLEETETGAKNAEEIAIMKRERAQMLMEVADLLTYKASVALRIAEARAKCDGNDDEFLGVDFGSLL